MLQNYPPKFGELRSIHRPSKPRYILVLALGTPLLIMVVLSTLVIFNSFTRNEENSLKDVSNYFICLGVMGLLLALLSSILVSDYRAWSATKTMQLTIYQEGFTYESAGHIELCRWNEIEKFKFKFITVHSKAFRTRAKVIRAIVKKNGTEIELAETLNLTEITELITKAKEKGC